jgi:hypothetical protein
MIRLRVLLRGVNWRGNNCIDITLPDLWPYLQTYFGVMLNLLVFR